MRANLTLTLHNLDAIDITRASIQKNSLINLTRFNVLQQDQTFPLWLLDQTTEEVDYEPNLVFILTLSKFGQKSKDDLFVAESLRIKRIFCLSDKLGATLSVVELIRVLLWDVYQRNSDISVTNCPEQVAGAMTTVSFIDSVVR